MSNSPPLKKKIVIIGAGVAGLSAATMLCNIPNLEIVIYEKEEQIGGQMSSIYTNTCNVEHSWRVFNANYHNLWYIFKTINVIDNFTEFENNCVIGDNNFFIMNSFYYNVIKQVLANEKIENYHKYFNFLFECKTRKITEYDFVNAYEYFNKNNFIKLLLGPYAGLEATKTSLSSIWKNTYSLYNSDISLNAPKSKRKIKVGFITKIPTQDAIFVNWEKYLISKSVKICKSTSIKDIIFKKDIVRANLLSPPIKSIIVENSFYESHEITADDFIFASSIGDINKIISSKKEFSRIFRKNMINIQKKNLQLYFTANFYFSKKLNKWNQADCELFTLIDAPWIPIIQRKIHWEGKISQCNSTISEIWNVGFLDYVKGYNNKFVSECFSIEEVVLEGISQIKKNKFLNNIFQLNNTTFDESYLGYEVWNQFTTSSTMQNSTTRIIDLNPKFSVNVGTMHLLPETQPTNFPENMYLSGYYVKNSYGGASMESSCITGLNASVKIINKYGLKNPFENVLPYELKNNELLFDYLIIFLPFMYLDRILYYFHFSSIINYINSFYLFIFYFLFLFCIITYIIYFLASLSWRKRYRWWWR